MRACEWHRCRRDIDYAISWPAAPLRCTYTRVHPLPLACRPPQYGSSPVCQTVLTLIIALLPASRKHDAIHLTHMPLFRFPCAPSIPCIPFFPLFKYSQRHRFLGNSLLSLRPDRGWGQRWALTGQTSHLDGNPFVNFSSFFSTIFCSDKLFGYLWREVKLRECLNGKWIKRTFFAKIAIKFKCNR